MSHSEPAGLDDLIRRSILRFAQQPAMNPRHLDFPRYTVALIAHDYPAKTSAMWNSAYQRFGIDAGNIMLTGDANESALILEALRRDDRYGGGGAGVGFKEKAYELVDERDAFATAAGAINLISRASSGRLSGHNTDGIGFAVGLEELLARGDDAIRGKTVLMLGAGGTARSVAVALADRGAHLRIANRAASKAEALAAQLNAEFSREVALAFGEEETARLAVDAQIIVNVTTKGAAGEFAEYSALTPARDPSEEGALSRNLAASAAILDSVSDSVVVCDVVIAHRDTPLLRQARERGLRVMNGIAMVVNQAVEAFSILHGRELQERRVSKQDLAAVMRSAATSA